MATAIIRFHPDMREPFDQLRRSVSINAKEWRGMILSEFRGLRRVLAKEPRALRVFQDAVVPMSVRGRRWGGDRLAIQPAIAVKATLIDDAQHYHDPAVEFFTGVLGFDLVEDSPSLTNDGRSKRWVVVRPPGAQTGILLARASGERQTGAVGDQAAGRVGFFLRVDDFDAAYQRMTEAGVTFVREPRGSSGTKQTREVHGEPLYKRQRLTVARQQLLFY